MPVSYAQKIVAALGVLRRDGGSFTVEDLVFAMDQDVDYRGPWRVLSSKLIQPGQLDELIMPITSRGPSWIHANLIPTSDGRSLVTLRFGSCVGNPSPNINVSREVAKSIEVT